MIIKHVTDNLSFSIYMQKIVIILLNFVNSWFIKIHVVGRGYCHCFTQSENSHMTHLTIECTILDNELVACHYIIKSK